MVWFDLQLSSAFNSLYEILYIEGEKPIIYSGLSILYMRFIHGGNTTHLVNFAAFNSLYEILNREGENLIWILYDFQFSIWDSLKRSYRRLNE